MFRHTLYALPILKSGPFCVCLRPDTNSIYFERRKKAEHLFREIGIRLIFMRFLISVLTSFGLRPSSEQLNIFMISKCFYRCTVSYK